MPSVDEFGDFTARLRVGFIFDGYLEYRELDEDKHNISGDVTLTVTPLPPVKEHFWPPYDQYKNGTLNLEVHKSNLKMSIDFKLLYSCHGERSKTRLKLQWIESKHSYHNALTTRYRFSLRKRKT